MYKFFIKENQIDNKKITITGEDVNHIKNVLRLIKGSEIEVSNSDTGKSCVCEILNFDNNCVNCIIKNDIEEENEAKVYLNIFQGLPKSDKMELIIQKCTELGVKEFTPVDLNRCIVKLNGKDESKKIERWQKISEVAAKQSKRDIIPKVNSVIKLSKVIELIKEYDIMLVAYEEEKSNTVKKELQGLDKNKNLKIGILIGPEGGIEKEEIEVLKNAGAKIVTLGNRILRTETAPIVMTSVIMYELDEM